MDLIAGHPDRHVHLIMIATKPDIIKQVPLYKELKKRGHLVLLGHTGQHYDENLSGGMLKEFGVQPDFNLNVRGAMYEVVSQIIGRLGLVMEELKKRDKIVIPYVHGDTTTAMAASNAGYCHGFASVHVEAGIRTLTPKYREAADHHWESVEDFDVSHWYNFLQNAANWERGSQEPYPEQFNTRASEAATGVHLAPHELVKHFLESEGYAADRVFVVGNTVADATLEALENAAASDIFEKYPVLKDGDFVRFCIHRRENCTSEIRFRAIYDAMKSLILDGKKVLLISMFQTEEALKRYNLKEELDTLAKNYPTFIYSPVWSQYTDVIVAMSQAAVCATDSGSMQEEMNIMGVPCVTLRFGSDRSESIMNGSNIIAPPIDGKLIRRIIDFAWNNEYMRRRPKIYGENVSEKCIDAVVKVLAEGEVFRTEEERLHLG
ncbi:MAG: putative UDP-N-acetylglucosamine 2-epimerase [Candidatus Peribacteria bacterium]|nr:putative UDP-N-acetylglucosamine 2-epimerase [Candidatus Peribacteria bacterium]